MESRNAQGALLTRAATAAATALGRILPPPDHDAGRGPTLRQLQRWQPEPTDRACPRCGITAPPETITPDGCAECCRKNLPWQRVVRLGRWDAPLDDWIRSMKFGGRWALTRTFGRHLARRLPDRDDTLLVPVPMHWRRRVRRGYNQARLLADTIGRYRDWPLAEVLRRHRPTRPQSELPLSRRRRNLARALRAAPVDFQSRPICLVDDVKTSGATLVRCARLLKRRHAGPITVAVIAVADPPGHPAPSD